MTALGCLCSPVASGQAGGPRVTDPSHIGQALAQPAYTAILDGLTQAQIDAALVYRPDPQVSARLRETLGASGGPALRTFLANPAFVNAAQDGFAKLVGAYGYSSHNVADATAGFLWLYWQFIHDATLTETQIRGVHRQVRALFMGNAELRSLPSASRQTFAEIMAYTAAMQMLSSNNAKDPAARAEVRRDAAAMAKKVLGADLADLDVTVDNGFIRKAGVLSPGPAAAAPAPRPSAAAAAPAASAVMTADFAECNKSDSKDPLGRLDACTRVISAPSGDRNALALAYIVRASIYAQVREYDHVIADCDAAIRIGLPSLLLHPVLSLRGGALTHKHEYDRALADFNAAIAAPGNPRLADAYVLRGKLHLNMGRYGQALADLNKAIELKPDNTMAARAHAIRAEYHLEQDDNPGLLADANACIRIDPNIGDCHALRSQYYTRTGDFGAAQTSADRALALEPSEAFVRSVRGLLALARGRNDVAIGELNQAIDIDPLAPGALANRGVAFERTGRSDLAAADYRRALDLKPSSKMDREGQETARQRLAALAAAPAGPEAPSGRRIALVIGMTHYASAPPLRNPANDARAMADEFRRLGFAEVIEREDLTRAQLEEALKDFGDKAAGADWAVIYYAGHGIEINGANYLIPVDAKLARVGDVESETVSLASLLAKAQPAHKLRMVILDACRNNPFRMAPADAPRGDQGGSQPGPDNPVNMTPADGRSRGLGRGLAPVEPSSAGAVLVAFAARDGTVADDGVDHSPFTAALLTHLETPGLDIGILFRRVRDSVLARTNNVQEPYVYGSLPGEEFHFKVAAR